MNDRIIGWQRDGEEEDCLKLGWIVEDSETITGIGLSRYSIENIRIEEEIIDTFEIRTYLYLAGDFVACSYEPAWSLVEKIEDEGIVLSREGLEEFFQRNP